VSSIAAPATLRVTRTCADEDGHAHNPTALTFVVAKASGALIGTYIAGTDDEVVTNGSPTGTYILEVTLATPGRYRITSTQTWTMGDGQPASETQVTEEVLSNG
jgi:hypothetical protein